MFLVLTGTAVWIATASGYWVLLAVVVLLVGTREWFLPTRFLLDGDGATRRFLGFRRFKPWAQVKRASEDRRGVLLSPFPFPSRLEPFRGLYLHFAGNRDAVMAYVEKHMATRTEETGS